MSLYTAKTTKAEAFRTIDRLNAELAAARADNSRHVATIEALRADVELLDRNCALLVAERVPPHTSTVFPEANWVRGPRPAQPAPAVRDTGFAARAEAMRNIGAHLATHLGRPATRNEVLAEIRRLAAQ